MLLHKDIHRAFRSKSPSVSSLHNAHLHGRGREKFGLHLVSTQGPIQIHGGQPVHHCDHMQSKLLNIGRFIPLMFSPVRTVVDFWLGDEMACSAPCRIGRACRWQGILSGFATSSSPLHLLTRRFPRWFPAETRFLVYFFCASANAYCDHSDSSEV